MTAMVIVAIFAPLIATHDPNAYSLLDAKQSPSLHHFFGTTDQGTDIFSQVVWGAHLAVPRRRRRDHCDGARRDARRARRVLGGWVDDAVNLAINVFLVIPTIPLLVVVSAYMTSQGSLSMVMILGLTLWAFEARILRAQALSLRNRDFVLAAKVAGESTRRIIFHELMPNMISRIAAAFVLVFYVSILTEAGLEFLGLGNLATSSWGVTLYWAQVNSTVLQDEWWTFVFPGLRARADRRGARVHPRRTRRGQQPAAAPAADPAEDAVRAAPGRGRRA